MEVGEGGSVGSQIIVHSSYRLKNQSLYWLKPAMIKKKSVDILGWGRVGDSISASQSISQSSPESILLLAPTPGQTHTGASDPGAFGGTVVTGSILVVGRSSASAGGSGIVFSIVRGVDGLCSGSGYVTSVRCGWMSLSKQMSVKVPGLCHTETRTLFLYPAKYCPSSGQH